MGEVSILEKLLAYLNLIGLLAGLGVFIYSERVYKRPLPTDEEEFVNLTQEMNKVVTTKTFELDPIITNLMTIHGRLRFLELRIHLLPFKNKDFTVLEEKKSIIIDVILSLVGVYTAEEINSLAGKIKLENEIKIGINEKLKTKVIKKIFFTTFTVQ